MYNYAAVCKDGDVKIVGGATESEGRLEVCLGKRWGTIDGHGWTHTDTQVACRQLGYSTQGILPRHICEKAWLYVCAGAKLQVYNIFLFIYYETGVSYVKYDRAKHIATQSLPTHMTLVGCYGSEEKLINCSYHEFEKVATSAMDISVSCGTNDDAGTDKISSHAATIALIFVVLAIVFITVVAILIILFVMLRRKKKTQRYAYTIM